MKLRFVSSVNVMSGCLDLIALLNIRFGLDGLLNFWLPWENG